MFLTITANTALDRILFIEEFAPGKTMRTGQYIDSIGGKGLDISLVQHTFGVNTLGLAFIAGNYGKQLEKLLEQSGVPSDLVWVEGETRISHIIVESVHRRHSHIITSGYDVDDDDVDAFFERYNLHLPEVDWVIIAGTLPPGAPRDFYADLCLAAQKHQKPVLVDCFGPPATSALRARPTIIKMNRREMSVTFGLPTDTMDEIRHSASTLREKYGLENFVVTCGEEGVLLVNNEGCWRAFGPRQVEINGTGAGEAVSAMIPWRLSLGDKWPEVLRWAAAAGSATVLTKGSAEIRPHDVNRMLPDIRVISY